MAPVTSNKPAGNGETSLAPKTPAKEPSGPLTNLKTFIADPDTRKRLAEMLGARAGAFSNSIINVVKNSKALMDVARENPASIMTAAMIAASVNLPIDPALGFAAIVPYKNRDGTTAQFQLMYKGLIQLAIRSGQYERIHYTEVYRDEIESYNPITGDTKFTAPENWKMRAEGNLNDVAGFYAFFRLKAGFEASRYISFEQAMAHGRRFSKSFQADIQYKKAVSLWSTDPIAMGGKTCLKMLLGKYGILSIEMQDALVADSADFAGDPHHVDPTVVEGPETGGVEGLKARMLAEQGTSEAPTRPVAEEPAPEGTTAPPAEETQPVEASGERSAYTCTLCHKNFDTKAKGKTCPHCGAADKDIVATADLPPWDGPTE